MQVFHSYVKNYNISRQQHPSSFGNNFYIVTCNRDRTLYFWCVECSHQKKPSEDMKVHLFPLFSMEAYYQGPLHIFILSKGLDGAKILCFVHSILREFDSSPSYMNKYKYEFQSTVCNLAYVYCVISTSVEQHLLPESQSSGFSPIVANLKFLYLARNKEAGGNIETNMFVREN